jgi:hypothetical protein
MQRSRPGTCFAWFRPVNTSKTFGLTLGNAHNKNKNKTVGGSVFYWVLPESIERGPQASWGSSVTGYSLDSNDVSTEA